MTHVPMKALRRYLHLVVENGIEPAKQIFIGSLVDVLLPTAVNRIIYDIRILTSCVDDDLGISKV